MVSFILRFNHRVARRFGQQRYYDKDSVCKLRELSILGYHLQYEDQVADHCKEFRDKAAILQGKHPHFFLKKLPWTEVQALIEEKKELLE